MSALSRSQGRELRRLTKPFFHTPNLLGSLCKEIIETLLLTEMIAPPTMTGETELAIASVTSLHEFPRGSAAKVALIAQLIGMNRVMVLKATNSVEV